MEVKFSFAWGLGFVFQSVFNGGAIFVVSDTGS